MDGTPNLILHLLPRTDFAYIVECVSVEEDICKQILTFCPVRQGLLLLMVPRTLPLAGSWASNSTVTVFYVGFRE